MDRDRWPRRRRSGFDDSAGIAAYTDQTVRTCPALTTRAHAFPNAIRSVWLVGIAHLDRPGKDSDAYKITGLDIQRERAMFQKYGRICPEFSGGFPVSVYAVQA